MKYATVPKLKLFRELNTPINYHVGNSYRQKYVKGSAINKRWTNEEPMRGICPSV